MSPDCTLCMGRVDLQPCGECGDPEIARLKAELTRADQYAEALERRSATRTGRLDARISSALAIYADHLLPDGPAAHAAIEKMAAALRSETP